jgi:outer membrane biosynthesis protein TonB
MSFWDRFESSREGIEDTVEFTIRVAVITLACVVLVVVAALVVGLFASNDVVDSDKVFEIVGPAFNMVIGAFVGLLGGLSLNANARDAKPEEPTPVEPEPLPAPEPEPAPMAATPEPTPATEDDDDMAPWEKYRNDLRYDANGDGVVDENDFPDWRNPRA